MFYDVEKFLLEKSLERMQKKESNKIGNMRGPMWQSAKK
jgi:hypothetical protein